MPISQYCLSSVFLSYCCCRRCSLISQHPTFQQYRKHAACGRKICMVSTVRCKQIRRSYILTGCFEIQFITHWIIFCSSDHRRFPFFIQGSPNTLFTFFSRFAFIAPNPLFATFSPRSLDTLRSRIIFRIYRSAVTLSCLSCFFTCFFFTCLRYKGFMSYLRMISPTRSVVFFSSLA